MFEEGVDEGLDDFGDFFFVFGVEQDVGTGVELGEEVLDVVDVVGRGFDLGIDGLEGGEFLGELWESFREVLVDG